MSWLGVLVPVRHELPEPFEFLPSKPGDACEIIEPRQPGRDDEKEDLLKQIVSLGLLPRIGHARKELTAFVLGWARSEGLGCPWPL